MICASSVRCSSSSEVGSGTSQSWSVIELGLPVRSAVSLSRVYSTHQAFMRCEISWGSGIRSFRGLRWRPSWVAMPVLRPRRVNIGCTSSDSWKYRAMPMRDWIPRTQGERERRTVGRSREVIEK